MHEQIFCVGIWLWLLFSEFEWCILQTCNYWCNENDKVFCISTYPQYQSLNDIYHILYRFIFYQSLFKQHIIMYDLGDEHFHTYDVTEDIFKSTFVNSYYVKS